MYSTLRISSAGVIRSYRTNLMKSRAQLEAARQTASDFMAFRSFGENPAGATKAFRLIRSYGKTENYMDSSKVAQSRLSQAWESSLQIEDLVEAANKEDIKQALNGTNDIDARNSYVETLEGKMESIVQSLNAEYNGHFVFAGQSADSAPFAIDDDYNIYYHDVNVDTGAYRHGSPQAVLEGKCIEAKDDNGDPILDENGEQVYYKLGKDGNPVTLDQLAKEKIYFDIGLGMKGNSGEIGGYVSADDINTASGMNVAIPGISLVGYGMDDKGMPNNVVSQIREICNLLKKDSMTEEEREKAGDLWGKVNDSYNKIVDKTADFESRVSFMNSNTTRLKKNSDQLYAQITELTRVEPALAYTNFSFAQYYYNSALKIGNSILDQSFIDYMR